MGYIEQISCPSCGKSWECRCGCGMMHGRLENVLQAFPNETIADIKEVIGQQRFPNFDFNYRALTCDNCKNVVSVPVIKLPDDGKIYIGNCPRCKSPFAQIPPGEISKCPHCGEEPLLVGKIGLWD